MNAKISALLVTMVLNIVAAVVIFIILLIVMNGYSESEAGWGLLAFILLAAITAAVMSAAAFRVAGFLTKRAYKGITAVLITTPIFTLLGLALEAACAAAGILVAELVRTNF
jgi:hypothetical protein